MSLSARPHIAHAYKATSSRMSICPRFLTIHFSS
uniref:Uncharacterized protein n=1 Tax=Manihot esculenta TaxID=3983 RepID=A0A2C9URX1_MANES